MIVLKIPLKIFTMYWKYYFTILRTIFTCMYFKILPITAHHVYLSDINWNAACCVAVMAVLVTTLVLLLLINWIWFDLINTGNDTMPFVLPSRRRLGTEGFFFQNLNLFDRRHSVVLNAAERPKLRAAGSKLFQVQRHCCQIPAVHQHAWDHWTPQAGTGHLLHCTVDIWTGRGGRLSATRLHWETCLFRVRTSWTFTLKTMTRLFLVETCLVWKWKS